MYSGKSAEGIAGKIKYSFPLVAEIVEDIVYLFDSPTQPPLSFPLSDLSLEVSSLHNFFLFVVPLVLVGFGVASFLFVLLGLVSPNEALGRPSRVVSKAFPSLDHKKLDPYPPKQTLCGHKEDKWSLVLMSSCESQASWWELAPSHAGLSFPLELPMGTIQHPHPSPPLLSEA